MAKQSNCSKSAPGTESVNKWKIPHYYRRSSNASSQHSFTGETVVPSAPSTPNINVMASPRRVLMDDPKKSGKRSICRSRKTGKKKSGEMVFVNYTVQDSASEGEAEIPSSNSITPVDMGVSPLKIKGEAINRKKKSSRSRMLKIFGSSKDSSDKKTTQQPYSEGGVCSQTTAVTPKNNSLTAKRSYSSFLKYGKFHGSSVSTMQPPATSEYTGTGIRDEEIVPKSSNNPKNARAFVQANTELFANQNRGIGFLNRKKAYSELNINKFTSSDLQNDGLPIDHHYLNESDHIENQPKSFYPDGKTIVSEPSLMDSHINGNDENDASIAFTKMFTKKRANTGGSMSSLTSLNSSSQQINLSSQTSQNMASSYNRNLSVCSMSSSSNRFSPVRAMSPARPRSATRGSSSHRISRDSSSLQNLFDVNDVPGIAESYLDIQIGGKNSSTVNNRHKRKQESISDTYRNPNNNSVGTPSSSLVTPPAFNSNYTVISSTSASSTPSAIELPNGGGGQMSVPTYTSTNSYDTSGYSNIFDHDSSTEVLNHESDMPTPNDALPALREIPRTTIEESEEKSPNTKKHLRADTNHENFDHIVFVNGSSTESSQVDLMLTNSVFSLPSNHIWLQQEQANCTTSNEGNINKYLDKPVNFSAQYADTHSITGHPTDSSANNDMEKIISRCSNNTTDPPLNHQTQKMHIEFDFENTNSFFQESSVKNNNDNHINCENSASSNTPINGQTSTVTSVANISPGTTATLSVEDFSNGYPYHRNIRDQYNGNNTVIHSNSLSSQSNLNPNSGSWMMNSDLDAIANSSLFNDDPGA